MDKERKKQLTYQFWKIENLEEALYVINQCSYGFLFIAGLNILVGFIINRASVIDGIAFLILGLLLYFLKSRVASILLLLISGAGIIVTFLNKIGVTYGSGSNIILAIIVFYFAVATVYATFKYHRLNGRHINSKIV